MKQKSVAAYIRAGAVTGVITIAACISTGGDAKAQEKGSTQPAPISRAKPAAGIHLQFVNTDISDVLQAISMKTHANIVYSALTKRPVSLNMTATTVTEAIGFAASAAGLTFREMSGRYFVAPASDLKQLVEAFGSTEKLDLKGLGAADATALLSGALPYLTIRPAGQQLIVTGDPADIEAAKSLLDSQARPLSAPRNVSAVVSLKMLVPSQAATMLSALYPSIKAEAVGTSDKAGGAVGLYGPEPDVNAARETLLKLELSTPAVVSLQPIYRVYRVKYSGADALKSFLEKAMPGVTAVVGPDHAVPPQPIFKPLSGATSTSSSGGSSGGSTSGSGSGSGSSGGSTGGGADAGTAKTTGENDRASLLVISGPESQVTSAIKMLEEVDLAPGQVMIEVKVIDISPEQSESLGVNWNWTPLTAIETAAGTALTGTSDGTPTITSLATRPKQFGYFSRVPETIQAVVTAMVTNKQAKILASPRIEVLDKDDANIFIGDTLRTQVSQSGISGTTVQVFEFPVGIILLVRPRINVDGQITMRIHPVVSTITSMGVGNLPQTSTREAETVVRVKDGETMVIGGLIRDEMSKVVQSVPILSRLPLVGELFKSTTKDHTHSEIMVFITPHIIK